MQLEQCSRPPSPHYLLPSTDSATQHTAFTFTVLSQNTLNILRLVTNQIIISPFLTPSPAHTESSSRPQKRTLSLILHHAHSTSWPLRNARETLQTQPSPTCPAISAMICINNSSFYTYDIDSAQSSLDPTPKRKALSPNEPQLEKRDSLIFHLKLPNRTSKYFMSLPSATNSQVLPRYEEASLESSNFTQSVS